MHVEKKRGTKSKTKLPSVRSKKTNEQRVGFLLFALVSFAALAIINHDSIIPDSDQVAIAEEHSENQVRSIPVRVYQSQIKKEFFHDRKDFVEGWDIYQSESILNNQLILIQSTGLYGRSHLYKYKYPDLKQPLKQISLDQKYFGEGCALKYNDDNMQFELYVLTYKKRTVLVYDFDNFEILRKLSMPEEMKEGWGLHYDSNQYHQFLATDGSSQIFFIDPSSFTVTKKVRVFSKGKPLKRLNDLTVVNGWIIANVWFQSQLVVISPLNGQVYGYIECNDITPLDNQGNHNAILNGVTFNPVTKNLVITGKMWTKFYEIETPSFILDFQPSELRISSH